MAAEAQKREFVVICVSSAAWITDATVCFAAAEPDSMSSHHTLLLVHLRSDQETYSAGGHMHI